MDEDKYEIMSKKIKELYAIVNDLEECFPGRHFTPDGHLVGSIGEVLASHYYNLRLLTASSETHDAVSPNGKMVQIKATQVNSIGLSSEPEHLIVLKILKNGEAEEIYNGPGKIVWDVTGDKQKNGQRYVNVSKLKELMKEISQGDRLEKFIEPFGRKVLS